MRIGIVNDLSLAREVLRRVVLSVPGYSVAWAAEDGDEAIKMAASDSPDAILMDLVMPRVNGVEATRAIMKKSPCPILVVTATVSGHISKVYQAMGSGALDAVDTPVLGSGGDVAVSDPSETVDEKVLQLRQQGLAYARISRDLGLASASDAQQAFRRAVRRRRMNAPA